MEKNVEIEMKLVIGKKALQTLLSSPLFQQLVRQGSEKQRHLVSTYYDTEDLALKKQGIAYRVRDKGDGSWEATVKTAQQSSNGLSRRLELNLPLTENKPVLTGFADLGLGYELTDLAGEGVEPLFTVAVDRTTYLLDVEGAVVEMALDQGKITTPKNRRAKDTIAEVELELLEGEIAPLLKLVVQLTELVPVFVEKRSKFARGLALLGMAGDERLPKVRVDMQAPVRQQVLRLVQQRGDALLLVQNLLCQKVTPELVKELQKQLHYLQAYLCLGKELAADELLVKALDGMGEIAALAEHYQVVAELSGLWQQVRSRGGAVLDNGVLGKRLVLLQQDADQHLQRMAQAGKLSQVVYQALCWLQLRPWQNETYLELASLAKGQLQAWQEAGAEACLPEAALYYWQQIYCLSHSLPGKAYAKIAHEAKDLRKDCQEELRRRSILQLVQGIAHGSNSRILTRDVGVVMGWLWAAE